MAIAYFEAPHNIMINEGVLKGKSVFLAGGITDCPDWQNDLVYTISRIDEELKNSNLNVYNPRRENFPINDPNASEAQIGWEWEALRHCEINLFWFSEGSLNPIVLFELGSAMERIEASSPKNKTRELIIGCHENYLRKRDVEIQVMEQLHMSFPIHSSLNEMAVALMKSVNLIDGTLVEEIAAKVFKIEDFV